MKFQFKILTGPQEGEWWKCFYLKEPNLIEFDLGIENAS